MDNRVCLDCKSDITGLHHNRKRCEPCAVKSRKKPIGTMTKDQIEEAKRLAGTMPRESIAELLGVSLSNLKRSCPEVKFTFFNRFSNNPELVKEVVIYFEENGIKKTKERFPDISVRSIIEHYPRNKARQKKWTDEEIIQAIKFGPFVSLKDQFLFFKRPRAFEGSIRSLWSKRIKGTRSRIHGLPSYIVKEFLNLEAKPHPTKLESVKELYTWETLKKNIKKDAPDFLKETINAGYKFHLWLYGENPNNEITRIYNQFDTTIKEKRSER